MVQIVEVAKFPRASKERCTVVKNLFDRQLARLGQVLHIGDVLSEISEIYGANHEIEVLRAVNLLVKQGILEETSPANYKRVVK